jgi:hypothetical protein
MPQVGAAEERVHGQGLRIRKLKAQSLGRICKHQRHDRTAQPIGLSTSFGSSDQEVPTAGSIQIHRSQIALRIETKRYQKSAFINNNGRQ